MWTFHFYPRVYFFPCTFAATFRRRPFTRMKPVALSWMQALVGSASIVASAFAGVEHGQAHHFFAFVAHDHVVVGHLAVSGVAGLLEVDVKPVGLGVVG